MTSKAKPAETTTLLATFFLGESAFAVNAGAVQEVIRAGPVTPVRHSPPEVAGVINLRGRIVTLLDTGRILGATTAVLGRDSRVLVLEDRNEFLGLLVDRMGEVIEAEPGTEESLPANIPPAQARFFAGICRSGGRVLTLLDPAAVLSGVRN